MSAPKWVLFSVLLLLAALVLAAVLTPAVREGIQQHFNKSGREVLATAEGNLLGDGHSVKVIKYRYHDEIWVEVLKTEDNGSTTAIDRILLPDKHDGLFNFQGHVTRLAIADVDHDGSFELLAPTFDQQLVPHLNVFRYNPSMKKFEPFVPPSHEDAH